MRQGACPTIQLIYMANSWRKRSKFSSRELDMPNRTGRLIYMCKWSSMHLGIWPNSF